VSDALAISLQPRLLLVSGHRWPDTCRLALAAHEAGFEVNLLAPKGHPLAELRWVHPVGFLPPLRPQRVVAHVLNSEFFDLVLAADDLGVSIIFDVFLAGSLNDRAASIVTTSFGDPESFGFRHSRARIGAIATETALVAPRTWPVTAKTLRQVVEECGFPAVFKVDGGFGGQQVIVAHDLDAAAVAFATLRGPQGAAQAIGRLILDHDSTYLAPALSRVRPEVSVQQFVAGEPATLTVACWKGVVLDSVGCRVLRTSSYNGPATVVEAIEHPNMLRAARVIGAALGLSGLFGLDFVIADDSSASLIELNPRATPTSHLHPSTLQRPLLHLLADAVGSQPPAPGPPLPAGPIVLVPQARLLDPEAVDPADAHLDLPDDPEVMELCRAAIVVKPLAPFELAIRRIF
jgi:hypothetical protein